MKKFRIIISLILAISLLPVFPAYADEEEIIVDAEETVIVEEPADTPAEQPEKEEEPAEEVVEEVQIPLVSTDAFKMLESFGIMTAEDEIVSAEYVSRAQFMKYAMISWLGRGASATGINAANPFKDIDKEADGAAEIATACKLGIISAGDKFRPDDLITMPEAAKILVSLLGWGDLAYNKGGYPTGYLLKAKELKLFEECDFTAEGYISVSDFAQVLVNTLEADVMDISSIWKVFGAEGASYTVYGGRTLLEYTFGIYKTEGIVESNKYTSVNGLTTMYDDIVEIGGVKYKENGTTAGEYLGYNTLVYYSLDDAGVNKLIEYIVPFNNETIYVVSDDIVPESTTNTNFAYYDDAKDRVRNEAIPRSATLIYNGGQKPLTAANITPANGTVTLVDNNRDGDIDVVFVMNYRTILVSSVSLNSGVVGDLFTGTSIDLDSEDDSYDFYVDVDGIPAGLESINVRSVISYAESTGCTKNVKYVKVSTKTITGAPEAIGDETVVINGQEYYITDSLLRSLTLKDSGTFYLDFTGKIVAKKSEKDVVYGYFNKVIPQPGMDTTIRAQIFTENNRWVELDLKDKIHYTSELYDGDRVDADVFYRDWVGGNVKGNLFTYTVDADGKINMITQPEEDYTVDYTDAEREAVEQDVFRKHFETGKNLTYGYASSSGFKYFGTEFFVNDNTKIFTIPANTNNLEEFSVMSVANLTTSTTYNDVVPYDFDAFRTAGVVVMESVESIHRTSSIMVVDSVMKSYNAAGKAVDAIRGYYKGILITLPLANNSILSQLSARPAAGDVIRFKMNADGDISVVKDANMTDSRASFYDQSAHVAGTNDFIVTAAKGTDYTSTPNSSYSTSYVIAAGTADYVDGSAGKFLVDIKGQKLILGTDKSSTFYIYDVQHKNFREGSIGDVERGKKMYIRFYYGMVREAVIYE